MERQAESFICEDEDADIPENIASIHFKSSVSTLSNKLCFQQGSLTSVHFEEGLQVVGEEVFFGCPALKNLSLPSTVHSAGVGVFAECTSLAQIDISRTKLTVVAGRAFQNCYNLRKILLPKTVGELGDEAFQCCMQLVSVEILDGQRLSRIGCMCFEGCESLRNLTLGGCSDDLVIGEDAFEGCESLIDCDHGKEDLTKTLKKRFHGLDLHRICYGHALKSQKELCRELDLIDSSIISQQDGAYFNLFFQSVSVVLTRYL